MLPSSAPISGSVVEWGALGEDLWANMYSASWDEARAERNQSLSEREARNVLHRMRATQLKLALGQLEGLGTRIVGRLTLIAIDSINFEINQGS